MTFVGQRDVQLVQAIESRVGRQMEEWKEEGVNLTTRVTKEALKLVGEKKREALLEIEEGREVGGKRKRGMQKLRAKYSAPPSGPTRSIPRASSTNSSRFTWSLGSNLKIPVRALISILPGRGTSREMPDGH